MAVCNIKINLEIKDIIRAHAQIAMFKVQQKLKESEVDSLHFPQRFL